jgi:glycosyltransferase 2 family protein
MDLDAKKILKTLNPQKVWVPIALGLGIVIYLFVSDPDITLEKLALVFNASPWPILLAVFVFFTRFLGYIYRIRTLTDKALTWTASLYTIILWEFASAVTPSVVGGTAVAVFILWKEGIKPGKALGYVFVTAIFDNLFFVITAPLVLIMGMNTVFPVAIEDTGVLRGSITSIYYISYSLVALYTFIMAFALFVNPRGFKWLLIKITSNRLLKKWQYAAHERGTEMIVASQELKGMGYKFWTKIALSTFFIWTSRYLLLNILMTSFSTINILDHFVIFGKQIVLWVVMLISPTPGSSGTAEYFFPMFFQETLGDYTLVVNLFWRLFTYYPYLLPGAFFLPRWVTRVFFHKK